MRITQLDICSSLDCIVATIQVLDFSFCVQQSDGSLVLFDIVTALQIALSALMCSLVTLEFIKQSFQMYRATERFQLSRYMNLLVREGIIYFFSYVYVSIPFPFFLPSCHQANHKLS